MTLRPCGCLRPVVGRCVHERRETVWTLGLSLVAVGVLVFVAWAGTVMP